MAVSIPHGKPRPFSRIIAGYFNAQPKSLNPAREASAIQPIPIADVGNIGAAVSIPHGKPRPFSQGQRRRDGRDFFASQSPTGSIGFSAEEG